jgi:hypothetical protein
LLFGNIKMSIAHAGLIRPWYLSNYGDDFERLAWSGRFSAWSQLRVHMGFDTIPMNISLWVSFALGCLAMLCAYLKDWRKWLVLVLILAVMCAGAYSLVVPTVADGEADLGKHMFGYVQFADMAFIVVVMCLLSALDVYLDGRKGKATEEAAESAGDAAAVANREPLFVRFAPVGIAGLLVLSMMPAIFAGRFAAADVADIGDAKVGDVVYLGNYNGEALRWLVVGETARTRILVAEKNVTEMAFDGGGGNHWADSSIRAWLNGDFFDTAFDDGEAGLVVESPHYLVLSRKNKELAQMGDREFYAFHIPAYAFRGTERAYRVGVSDKVRLPDAGVMTSIIDMGRRIEGGYWLGIPYFGNGEMVRYVSKDGYVLMKDAKHPLGVRPVIEVNKK